MTMSFFEKLKNRHGPQHPPRRGDNNAGFEWPQDEFDDEEGDMYEAPPCERPAVKVPHRQEEEEEDVYLDTTSSPAVPLRNAAPSPRPGKPMNPLQRAEVFSYESNTRNPPVIDRKEKPGRNKMMPPPPPPASNTEEDVYLDPNEEQEENDDLYLEPEAACSPAPRGPMRMSPSPKSTFVPSPLPMMKPPVPRAKSNSFLPSSNEVKTAPSVEARRTTFPTKLPPPTPSVKPPLLVNLKEAKPNLMTTTKPAAPFYGMRATKQSENENKEWFAGDCTRKTAEEHLLSVNKDGAFLIRHSSAQNTRQAFTLAVLYQQKVYNVPIRFLEEARGYALGKEGKKNEETFTTLEAMISHHRNNQLLLIDSKSVSEVVCECVTCLPEATDQMLVVSPASCQAENPPLSHNPKSKDVP